MLNTAYVELCIVFDSYFCLLSVDTHFDWFLAFLTTFVKLKQNDDDDDGVTR